MPYFSKSGSYIFPLFCFLSSNELRQKKLQAIKNACRVYNYSTVLKLKKVVLQLTVFYKKKQKEATM